MHPSSITAERPPHFAWLCGVTTLLSAVLLFLVQLIISKIILPWFGGGPAVWTTCMLFFTTLLLGGYAYAHWLVRAFDTTWQMRIHAFLTLAAAMTLPLTPPVPDSDVGLHPIRSILWLLAMNVGLPFLAISATGPLVQSWYVEVYHNRMPFRLYALSNVGSLAALWLFPLAIEPLLSTRLQDIAWSSGFGLYLMLLFALALTFERLPFDENEVIYPRRAVGREFASARDLAIWIGLPALAAVTFNAVTNEICQDVAPVPLLFIMPLSVYLLSLIIAFDSPRWYVRWVWGWLTVVALIAVAVVMLDYEIDKWLEHQAEQGLLSPRFKLSDYTDRADVSTIVYLAAAFCLCMVCHGETTRHRPRPGQLTLYYLAIAAGGAIGTFIVAVLCPLLLDRYAELNVAMVLGYLLAGGILVASLSTIPQARSRYVASGCASLILAAGLMVVLRAQVSALFDKADVRMRNFYGVSSVVTEHHASLPDGRILYNGRIVHGYQFVEGPRRYRPNTYYTTGSGVEIAISMLHSRNRPLRVGVIGLGTGTMACYGRRGDEFQFYEIDPKIDLIAHQYFTYLADSRAECYVRHGDARLYLQRQLATEGKQKFDLLVLDAFSGDAIPMHLLTLEAFQLYVQHVKHDGILAVHVSNRHLDLAPVVARLARAVEAEALHIERSEDGKQNFHAASDWVLVSGDPSLILNFDVYGVGRLLDDDSDLGPLWTDSVSNWLQVLR
jgi:hypothetical protein